MLYFAPVAIGAVRRYRDKSASWPVWALFLVTLLTGWTVIGWLVALRMAFRDKNLPGLGGQRPTATGSPAAAAWGTVHYEQYKVEDGWRDYITRIGEMSVDSQLSNDGTYFITRIGNMPVENLHTAGESVMTRIGEHEVEYQLAGVGYQVTYTRIGDMPVHYEAAPGGGLRMAYIGHR